jgi:hypothetical protein
VPTAALPAQVNPDNTNTSAVARAKPVENFICTPNSVYIPRCYSTRNRLANSITDLRIAGFEENPRRNSQTSHRTDPPREAWIWQQRLAAALPGTSKASGPDRWLFSQLRRTKALRNQSLAKIRVTSTSLIAFPAHSEVDKDCACIQAARLQHRFVG